MISPWARRPTPDPDLANPSDAYRRTTFTRTFRGVAQAVREARTSPTRNDDTLSPWDEAWAQLSPAEREWEWTP